MAVRVFTCAGAQFRTSITRWNIISSIYSFIPFFTAVTILSPVFRPAAVRRLGPFAVPRLRGWGGAKVVLSAGWGNLPTLHLTENLVHVSAGCPLFQVTDHCVLQNGETRLIKTQGVVSFLQHSRFRFGVRERDRLVQWGVWNHSSCTSRKNRGDGSSTILSSPGCAAHSPSLQNGI